MISSIPTLIPWLPLFCPILDHLSQLIYASTSLYHFCTYHNPVTFLFPALSRISSPSSLLPQPPFTISEPTIILWHSYSLPSFVSPLPTPTPLFCHKRLIGLCLHSPLPLSISILLPSAINYIQDYYYLIVSLLYIHIGVTFIYVLLLLSSILCWFYLSM